MKYTTLEFKDKIQQARSLNKYNLTVDRITKLHYDRSKITTENFWYNKVVHAWCVSGCIGDPAFCDESEYWLGIYDDKINGHSGKIELNFSCYGGMCSYNINEFFEPESIENQQDLDIQIAFIKRINSLIDQGILF